MAISLRASQSVPFDPSPPAFLLPGGWTAVVMAGAGADLGHVGPAP